jgi:SSS family solute:Na+ symporter
VVAALVIATLIAPLLGNLGQAFQFIQEFTGVVSPGILAVFLTGLFWKRATNSAAIWGVISSIPIALYFKVGQRGWSDAPVFVTIPFMDQMFYTAILSILIIIVLSQIQGKGASDAKGIILEKDLFKTSPSFNLGAFVILLLCTALYALFW